MQGFSRRRFIAIAAAVAAVPGSSVAGPKAAGWRGTAMGAPAEMTLAGLDVVSAQTLFGRVEDEIDRLEDIFSLYRPGSALSRLNRDGEIDAPPQELLEVLSLSTAIHDATGGAFDPTVQPLWQLFAEAGARGGVPDADRLAAARDRVGLHLTRFDGAGVRFDRPGMALTFNGIAQGYVADRVAGLLRRAGLTDVLVDMGEIQARGRRADGRPWQVGIAVPGRDRPVTRIGLTDRALATSAPAGTLLDAARGEGHILDPRTGRPGGAWRAVSVSARSAAVADGLSTALCLMDRASSQAALRSFPGARLEAMI